MRVRGGGRARLQVKLRVREWRMMRTGVSPTYLLNYLYNMFFYYTLYTSFKELTVQVLKYQTDVCIY